MKKTVLSTKQCEYGCPVEVTMAVLNGRWKLGILFHLFTGKKRFNELKKDIPGVSQRILTLHLRELEGDKIIKRTVFPEVPVRVEYELTAFGESLRPVVDSMNDWGEKYSKQVIKIKKLQATIVS